MENQAAGMFAGIGGLVYLAIIVLVVAGMWKLFEKAGKPGWAAIIPIYNYVVIHEIIGRDVWKVVLLLIPIVNLYFLITMFISFAKSYGKTGIGNYLCVIFLGFIFIPMWGFSSDVRYVGPSEGAAALAPTPGFMN